MREKARNRIDAHHMMRMSDSVPVVRRASRGVVQVQRRQRTIRRLWVHVLAFVLAYVFTVGASVLGMLLWVRPDGLLALVVLGLVAAGVFVAAFAAVRFIVLHRLMDDYADKEEDPGDPHHVSKSIMYGFVALVFAALLTGLLVNVASAAGAV